jgi:hypothetical protein
MTAHLTLNLIWLCLFLRNDKIGHGAAIAVGFLASGLHQLIFHPLVAPHRWSCRQAAHAPLLDDATQQCNSRSLADLGQGIAQRRAGDAHQA